MTCRVGNAELEPGRTGAWLVRVWEGTEDPDLPKVPLDLALGLARLAKCRPCDRYGGDACPHCSADGGCTKRYAWLRRIMTRRKNPCPEGRF